MLDQIKAQLVEHKATVIRVGAAVVGAAVGVVVANMATQEQEMFEFDASDDLPELED